MTSSEPGVKLQPPPCVNALATAAARLNASAAPTFRMRAPFSLAFLTDAQRLKARGVTTVAVIESLPPRTGVIFRDYDAPDRAATARKLAEICRRRGLMFFVAGDENLARAVKADGVHMPAHKAPTLAQKPQNLLLTAACHSAEELETAARLGADAAFLSPAFPTKSHPDTDGLGANGFKEVAKKSKTPVLALGGVTANNAAQLACDTVVGFGAIDAFVDRSSS